MQFRTKENGEKLIACLSRSSCRPRFYHKTRLLVTALDGWEYSARTREDLDVLAADGQLIDVIQVEANSALVL
jgi:hypothetical protein